MRGGPFFWISKLNYGYFQFNLNQQFFLPCCVFITFLTSLHQHLSQNLLKSSTFGECVYTAPLYIVTQLVHCTQAPRWGQEGSKPSLCFLLNCCTPWCEAPSLLSSRGRRNPMCQQQTCALGEQELLFATSSLDLATEKL